MYHKRKSLQRYRANNVKIAKQPDCTFCRDDTRARKLSETEHSYLLRNIIKYDYWENHPVEEHLMIIPKRHVTSLADMSPEERLDAMNIMAEYEAKGYSVYARGVGSPRRTVKHQHTHLIKIGGNLPRLVVRVDKPYFLWRF